MKSKATVGCLVMLILSTLAIACSGEKNQTSRVENKNLVVEYSVVCREGDVWLASSVWNKGLESVTIELGTMPWNYDPLGTQFAVSTATRKFKRQGGMPFFNRGPVVLAPNEKRTGEVPIGYMFPDFKNSLGKELVSVEWGYMEDLHGIVAIRNDPCRN
jgi:hypothetical protein